MDVKFTSMLVLELDEAFGGRMKNYFDLRRTAKAHCDLSKTALHFV